MFSDYMIKNPTKEGLTLARNSGVAGGGISIVLLASILQLESVSLPLQISIAGLAASLPLWVAYFVLVETFLYLGSDYYSYYQKLARIIMILMSLAGIGLVISIGSLFWHLSAWTGSIFIISVLIALTLSGIATTQLAKAIFESD